MKNIKHSSRPRRLTAMAGRFAAVVSIGTALLLLAGIHSSQAAEIKIVSPSAYKDIEGPDGGGGGTSPFRFQQVFPAADFAALGNKPHWLVGYTFRPDQSLTSPRTVHFPDNEVRLSTTQRGPDDLLSRFFDDNPGPDVMQFYRGLVIMAADIDGTSPVPREFYNAEFPAGVTPYLYDPSQGNLLFEAIGWQGISPSTFNDRVPGIQTTRHAASPSATQGEWIPAVIVQFTFIPVPEPRVVSIDLVPAGVRLRFNGVPGRSYNLERAPAVTGSWSTINTQTTPASGLLEYLDTTPHPGSGFYRTVQSATWGPAVSIDTGGLNNVNTAAMEGCPIESPDGRSLFFASNRAGGQGGIDIWTASRDGANQPWGNPLNLPPSVNSASDDFCPTPLADGELFFISRRPGGCGAGSADIYRTRLDPITGWLEPVHLGCEVNSTGDEFSPSYVAAGGGMLFFSSNRDGMHKIYASARKQDGSFGAPVEITELNAPGFNTFRPNVSEDGREIVFDSDRPGGLGGPDIWSASRSSVAHAWSAPVNLGPNVNSALTETRASLSRDGKRLTFGSTRPGGQGSSDIYVSTR